jgi:hypothetical protein
LFTATGRKRGEAQDRAAAAALDVLDPGWRERFVPGAEQRRLAHVGDAALDLLVSLLAHRRGLTPADADAVRQSVLTNTYMADAGGVAGRLQATDVEAQVGQRLNIDALEGMLKAAVCEADPALLGRIEAELQGRQDKRTNE